MIMLLLFVMDISVIAFTGDTSGIFGNYVAAVALLALELTFEYLICELWRI